MPAKNVLLTDVAQNVWLDSFSLSAADGPKLAGAADWSIRKHTLRGGLSDGVDVVELSNGPLSVSILPTRGMGIWKARYRDVPVGWDSPVKQPVNPAFINLTERSGLGWLAGFNELVCRCGLNWNGGPGPDVVIDNTGERIETPLTLHGKIANLPAHRVEAAVAADGPGTLSVTGVVDETMLFGPCLRLTSTVETQAGSNRFTLIDRVTNISGKPGELELLYHTNIGQPFLEQASKLVLPYSEVSPVNAHSAADMKTWTVYNGPTPGYIEQCYFVELLADKNDQTVALLTNAAGDKGVSLHFSRKQLPAFTLWKNTQAAADGYVTGLEPGTDLPNHKSFERKQGRVITLSAGQTYETRLEIAVHDNSAGVSAVAKQVQSLQSGHEPKVHPGPIAKHSPLG